MSALTAQRTFAQCRCAHFLTQRHLLMKHPQSFLSPRDPRFYRYVRVDFLSHYGSEYYCPVSLLRVYGLTQMEEYKLDEWQSAWLKEREAANVALEIEAGAPENEDSEPVEVVDEFKVTTGSAASPTTSSTAPVDGKPTDSASEKMEPSTLIDSEPLAISADTDTHGSHISVALPSATYVPLEAEIEDIVDQIMGGRSAYAYVTEEKCESTA